jgi:hypothetical protein
MLPVFPPQAQMTYLGSLIRTMKSRPMTKVSVLSKGGGNGVFERVATGLSPSRSLR